MQEGVSPFCFESCDVFWNIFDLIALDLGWWIWVFWSQEAVPSGHIRWEKVKAGEKRWKQVKIGEQTHEGENRWTINEERNQWIDSLGAMQHWNKVGLVDQRAEHCGEPMTANESHHHNWTLGSGACHPWWNPLTCGCQTLEVEANAWMHHPSKRGRKAVASEQETPGRQKTADPQVAAQVCKPHHVAKQCWPWEARSDTQLKQMQGNETSVAPVEASQQRGCDLPSSAPRHLDSDLTQRSVHPPVSYNY